MNDNKKEKIIMKIQDASKIKYPQQIISVTKIQVVIIIINTKIKFMENL